MSKFLARCRGGRNTSSCLSMIVTEDVAKAFAAFDLACDRTILFTRLDDLNFQTLVDSFVTETDLAVAWLPQLAEYPRSMRRFAYRLFLPATDAESVGTHHS